MRLGTGAVDVADDGRHAGLVAHGRRQVDGLLGVILGEAADQRTRQIFLSSRRGSRSCRFKNLRLDLSAVAGGTLPGKVGQRTVAGSLELRIVSIVVARASAGGEFCVRTLR